LKRYTAPLEAYGKVAADLNSEVIGLALNLIVDRVGGIGQDDNVTKATYLLRDSVLYRLSSLGHHLHRVCSAHVHNEDRLRQNIEQADLRLAHLALSFASDDLLFNLLSLYDYWANLVAYAYLGPQKKKIGWRGLAKASMDNKNVFSSSAIAPLVGQHHRSLALKLQDIRAEIIHYEHSEGKSRYEIHAEAGASATYALKTALPHSLSKKLQLTSVQHEGLGVDLPLGLIEISTRAVSWLADATKVGRESGTRNTITKRACEKGDASLK
jgi:hypothetical protein